MKKLLACLLLMTAPAWAVATNRYCSPVGNDANSGLTPNAAWTMIKASNSTLLNSGDTVWMIGTAGVYSGTPTFNTSDGQGSYSSLMQPARSGVIYKTVHGHPRAIIRGGASATAGPPYVNAMACNNASSITLDSIEFRRGAKFSLDIQNSGLNWTVRNCVFDSTPAGGKFDDNEAAFHAETESDHLSGWLIEDNEFKHCNGRGGIHVYGINNTIIRRNWFHDFFATSDGAEFFIKTGNTSGGGNHNVDVYGNIFDVRGGAIAGASAAWCDATVDSIRIHNNIFIGANAYYLTRSSSEFDCFNNGLDFRGVYIYNNTYDMSSSSNADDAIFNGRGSNPALAESIRDYYFFNNIFYRPPAASFRLKNIDNNQNYALFGNNWYSNRNYFGLRTAGQAIYMIRNSSGTDLFYTLSQWQTAATGTWNATWTGDPNSVANTSTTNTFMDPTNSNPWAGYILNPAGTNYTFLSTGGRGTSWPSYLGAIDPGADVCVSVTQNQPVNTATIAAHHVNIDMNLFDTNGDTATVYLIGERGDASPEDTIADTVLVMDDNWIWPWNGLTEDSTYYWKVTAVDTAGCVYTTPIWQFTVDSSSSPPPGPTTGIAIGNIIR